MSAPEKNLVEADSSTHPVDSRATHLKLRDDKLEQILLDGFERLEILIRTRNEKNVAAINNLADKLDRLTFHDQVAAIEARLPRQ